MKESAEFYRARNHRIRHQYRSGVSLSELAREYGLGRRQLRWICFGVSPRPPAPIPARLSVDDVMRELGLSPCDVQRMTGRDVYTKLRSNF